MLYSTLPQARKRVETAVDIIQKHLIVDTKNELSKVTAMLKDVWGHLTDMRKDLADVKGKLEAGFAEMRAGLKNVNEKLDQHHEDTHGKLDKQDEKLDQILGLVAQSDTKEPVLTHATVPPEGRNARTRILERKICENDFGCHFVIAYGAPSFCDCVWCT